MREKGFEENKVVPSIFKQFWSRNHLNKLDQLTPQDIYYSADAWKSVDKVMKKYSDKNYANH